MPVLRSQEFRSFILKSPLMQATVFKTYLALRGRPWGKVRLERLKNGVGAGARHGRGEWNEHWIRLQLSEAGLSTARASEKIGFNPEVDFVEGLKRSASWFEQYGLISPDDNAQVLAAEQGCFEAKFT